MVSLNIDIIKESKKENEQVERMYAVKRARDGC